MTPRVTRGLIVLAALLVLGSVNWAVLGKERVIREGETVFLELAPVDPRSLMQGDYMALRFRLADDIRSWRATEGREGLRTAPLAVDDRGVASLATEGDGTLEMAFRVRGDGIWLGTNAYFFAEGTAERYEAAEYGEFRVDPTTGEAVLVALRDADLDPL